MKRYLSDVRLGDLLVNAGVISIKQLGEAFRKVGNSNLYLGQMLVLCGFLKTQDLTAGLEAQSHIKDRLVDPRTARRALGLACKHSITFQEALVQLGVSLNSAAANKLGDLLLEAQLIEPEQLRASLEKSQATGLPLGRVLVLNFALPEKYLIRALEMQLRLRDGLITKEEAIERLANSASAGDDLEITFAEQHVIRLGELLVRAGILSKADVLNVLEVGLDKNQKIGQLFIKFGFLNDYLLEAALNLQQMIDNSFLHPQQAARCLAHVDAMSVPVSQALVELGYIKMTRRAPVSGVAGTSAMNPGNPDSTFGF
ncbi:MAG TPA: hypothetical protein V6C72_12565, partial [Chroococcales cyanobacterium]